MLRSIVSVSGIVILAKVLGFIKQMVTADAFGATIQTDLISISEGLVINMDYLLIHALSTAFIPTYINVAKISRQEEEQFVSNTIKLFAIVTFAIAALFFTASPLISRILAPSYTGDLSDRLAGYIRIFAPVLILITEMSIFNSLLKANEKFVPGELIGFNQSVIIILLVLTLGRKIGPDVLVVSFYAYAVFNLAFLMFHSRRLWRIRSGNPFRDPHVRKQLVMMGPLLLGYSVVFVNQQVDKIIVSGMGDGTVTAMHYASVLSNFIATFITSISGVLFTYITKHIAEGRDEDAAALTTTSTVQIITLFIPISVLAVLNAPDIVKIVFGRGKFDDTAVQNCSAALVGYACMFVPYVVRELYSRFQYGYSDSRRPMINSTIAIGVNIVLSILLSRFIGVLGVTLATSVSVAVCGVLNYITSKKRNPYISLREYVRHLPRWIAGIALCVAVSLLARRFLGGVSPALRFAAVVFIALACYGAVSFPILKPMLKRLKK